MRLAEQQPTADTRYVKQRTQQGEFAAGERAKPPVPEIDDFASGEPTLPVPENPDLVVTLPPALVVPDKKE